MSKAVDLFTFSNIVVATHDQDDLATLATFLLALSKADLGALGVRGAAQIRQHGDDYVAVFAGGNTLARPTRRGAIVLRKGRCYECNCVTWGATEYDARYCSTKHWAKFNCEEEKIAV